MFLEESHARQDPVERGPARRIGTVVVLDLGGPVQADANTEVVAPEELRPLGCQTCRIGLKNVLDELTGPTESGLDRHGVPIEIHREEGGLATVPSERHDFVGVVLHRPRDRMRQHLEGHGLIGASLPVVAVRAAQIAEPSALHDQGQFTHDRASARSPKRSRAGRPDSG